MAELRRRTLILLFFMAKKREKKCTAITHLLATFMICYSGRKVMMLPVHKRYTSGTQLISYYFREIVILKNIFSNKSISNGGVRNICSSNRKLYVKK